MIALSMARMSALVLALAAFMVSPSSSVSAEQAQAEQKSSGQPITLADLQWSEVHMKIARDQVVRREGRQFPVRVNMDLKLAIGFEGIEQTFTSTAHGPRGTRQSQPMIGSFIVNRVRDVRSLGGGRAVWQFADGTLTFMRTYKQGAYRRTVAFTRGAQGLTCTVSESFARENGTGSIELNSLMDGRPTTIVRWKPVSSSCRVAKR
jgi:carbohydrate-selective porin OprB